MNSNSGERLISSSKATSIHSEEIDKALLTSSYKQFKSESFNILQAYFKIGCLIAVVPIYPSVKNGKFSVTETSSFQKIFCLASQSILISYFINKIFWGSRSGQLFLPDKPEALFGLANFILYFCATLSFHGFCLKTEWENPVAGLLKVSYRYVDDDSQNTKWSLRARQYFHIIGMALVLICHFTMSYLPYIVHELPDMVKSIFYPNPDGDVHPVKKNLLRYPYYCLKFQMTVVIIQCNAVFAFYLSSYLVYRIGKEFERLHKNLVVDLSICNEETEECPKILDTIVNNYFHVKRLLEALNNVYGHGTFFMVLSGFPTIGKCLASILNSQEEAPVLGFISNSYAFIMYCGALLMAAEGNYKIQRFMENSLEKLSKQFRSHPEMMTALSYQLSSSSVGLQAGDYFTVSYTLLGAIATVMGAYVAFVLQFTFRDT